MGDLNPAPDPGIEGWDALGGSGKATPSDEKSGFFESFVENVEAIIVAIILAVVIRQFVLEAFKIPTPSMSPTLLGESGNKKYGDRVLVNKFIYEVSDPKLWDIVVFKFPYANVYCRDCGWQVEDHAVRNRDRCPIAGCESLNVLLKKSDFIKRLVGLPGQTLSVAHGDIYLDGEISRKTDAAQESLWLPESDVDFSAGALGRWTPTAGQVSTDSGKMVIGGESPARIEYSGQVEDAGNNRFPLGDLRLMVTVKAMSDAGALSMVIQEDQTTYRLQIPVEGSDLPGEVRINGVVQKTHDARLSRSEFTEVAFANVDDAVILTVNGDERVRILRTEVKPAFGPDSYARRMGKSGVHFETDHLAVQVTRIKLEKDVYYTNGNRSFQQLRAGGTLIPQDQYFFMGDNSSNSHDSRVWGTVQRDQIVGKAFMIFWPFPPAYSENRVGLIH